MDSPVLYVIAGPNGIGKTTSTFDLIPGGTPIINSDEIAEAVRNSGIINPDTNTQEYSNREGVRLMNEHLEKRASFAIETNLADLDTWKFLIETQKTGYSINLIYLSTDDLELLNSRIQQRTQAGGHFVRPDIVRERYLNSLNLLQHYFTKPDIIQLFDNSKSLTLIAKIKNRQVVEVNQSMPGWADQYLGNHLKPQTKQENKQIIDMKSVEEVRKNYLNQRENAKKLPEELKSDKPRQGEEKKISRRPKL